MSKVFVIDVSLCTGCDNCQLACKDEHVGNDWAPIARPQPEIGQFWMKLNKKTCGTVPKVRVNHTPTLCNHCEVCKCMEADTNGAVWRNDDGFIIFDTEKAVGQKQLVDACPYGAVYWNEELQLPQKCTGCAHLLDNGYKLPRCVEVCPTEALKFGDEEELADEIRGAAVLQPETGCKPHVYYRNLPGQFIAGTVFDPDEDEVIIGARVRLQTGGKRYRQETDAFGDFWFDDLAVGKFNLYIDVDGYETKVFENIDTQECVNLGDIPMSKKK